MDNIEAPPPPNTSSDDGASIDHHQYLPQLSDSNGDGESERKLSPEQVKEALQVTASTGNFWLDWEDLKSMLSFQLKQVLSEYPEATMPDDQQKETYLRLLKRLEEALFSFIEGPPFTLQRLSEILLDARKIYPKLSKLALALEKNLLVTSTLTKCTDPYPTSIVQLKEQAQDTQPQTQTQPQPQPQSESQAEREDQQPEPKRADPHSDSVENGQELMMGDKDEVMTEVDAEVEGGITIEMETFEEIITTCDTNLEPTSNS
ncbi:uncharacterized protein LOC141647785 isoform X2 [Silene latifolia]|uniref:uncharacterized protein LOC141647785 isoform X2 n=1 Tax=Silene latifolia TaxID=37657 RepID=UPI003D772525